VLPALKEFVGGFQEEVEKLDTLASVCLPSTASAAGGIHEEVEKLDNFSVFSGSVTSFWGGGIHEDVEKLGDFSSLSSPLGKPFFVGGVHEEAGKLGDVSSLSSPERSFLGDGIQDDVEKLGEFSSFLTRPDTSFLGGGIHEEVEKLGFFFWSTTTSFVLMSEFGGESCGDESVDKKPKVSLESIFLGGGIQEEAEKLGSFSFLSALLLRLSFLGGGIQVEKVGFLSVTSEFPSVTGGSSDDASLDRAPKVSLESIFFGGGIQEEVEKLGNLLSSFLSMPDTSFLGGGIQEEVEKFGRLSSTTSSKLTSAAAALGGSSFVTSSATAGNETLESFGGIPDEVETWGFWTVSVAADLGLGGGIQADEETLGDLFRVSAANLVSFWGGGIQEAWRNDADDDGVSGGTTGSNFGKGGRERVWSGQEVAVVVVVSTLASTVVRLVASIRKCWVKSAAKSFSGTLSAGLSSSIEGGDHAANRLDSDSDGESIDSSTCSDAPRWEGNTDCGGRDSTVFSWGGGIHDAYFS